MEIMDAIVDSIIRGALLGVSLAACGYGLWCFLSFLARMARKMIRRISDKADRLQ